MMSHFEQFMSVTNKANLDNDLQLLRVCGNRMKLSLTIDPGERPWNQLPDKAASRDLLCGCR